jgi:hypothetical protein
MKTIIVIVTTLIILSSCTTITREETDTFTITELDTTTNFYVPRSDIEIDGGIIHPSTRTIESNRTMVQRDSIIKRYYPDFIRLGLFESIGIIGGKPSNKIGTGLFGLFPDFNKLDERVENNERIFSGGIYRLGIVEKRLRWFEDSPNWTYGTHALEFIIPDSRAEKMLVSVTPLYVRKRYFIREDIPYLALTFSAGIGWMPSQYINLSASLDLGSMGGVNFRAYTGFAVGVNSLTTPQIKDNEFADEMNYVTIPYVGLGISLMDFHNKPSELYTEWKDHEHSAWNIGVAQAGLLLFSTEQSMDDDEENKSLISGLSIKLINVNLALPFLDYRAYVGTSLMNMLYLSNSAWGMGVLPIRAGFWQTLIKDELILDPYIEYNYYPSSIFTIGARLNLVVTENLNISLIGGYSMGKRVSGLFRGWESELGRINDFSGAYVGVGINTLDRIFYRRELRYK